MAKAKENKVRELIEKLPYMIGLSDDDAARYSKMHTLAYDYEIKKEDSEFMRLENDDKDPNDSGHRLNCIFAFPFEQVTVNGVLKNNKLLENIPKIQYAKRLLTLNMLEGYKKKEKKTKEDEEKKTVDVYDAEIKKLTNMVKADVGKYPDVDQIMAIEDANNGFWWD